MQRLISVALFLSTVLAWGAVDRGQLEVLQTEATLFHHSQDHQKCVMTLNRILAMDPNNSSALELLALSQRALKNEEAAAAAYQQLLKTGPTENRPAYSFELGTIRYRQKKSGEARRHLTRAVKALFNPGTSHFFLGMLEFDAKAWRTAIHHLSASMTYSDAEPMKPVARYYLANAYAQVGKSDAAMKGFYEASREEPARPQATGVDSLTGDIRKNALKALKDYDKSTTYASVSLISQYDSNVQTNPADVDAETVSNQRSAKAVLSGNVGHSTSPLETLQFIPSYSIYTNYNVNKGARDYNFLSQTPSLYMLLRPYKELSWGLKAEGTLSMKNNLTASDSRSTLKYQRYSLTGDIGPLVKYAASPRVNLSLETTYRPKKYYFDPADGNTRRSGMGGFMRFSSEFVTPIFWLTPLVYLSYEFDNTNGNDYRYEAPGFGASNTSKIIEDLNLTASFDITLYDYTKTSPKRDDAKMDFKLLANYTISPTVSAMMDVGYTRNESTVAASYRYNRVVTSLGATYSF